MSMRVNFCPFCGHTKFGMNYNDNTKKFSGTCLHCGCRGPEADSEEEALLLWDNREFVAIENMPTTFIDSSKVADNDIAKMFDDYAMEYFKANISSMKSAKIHGACYTEQQALLDSVYNLIRLCDCGVESETLLNMVNKLKRYKSVYNDLFVKYIKSIVEGREYLNLTNIGIGETTIKVMKDLGIRYFTSDELLDTVKSEDQLKSLGIRFLGKKHTYQTKWEEPLGRGYLHLYSSWKPKKKYYNADLFEILD